MTGIKQQKGFTLVELAIVITIIGLLIGGILKGQQLMVNARVTATIQQVKAVEAASTTFYDSYGALPGDMDGQNLIPGCTAACGIPALTARNGVIGNLNWPMTTPQYTGALAANEASEPGFFWYYLAATGMISGIDGSAPSTATPEFGRELPATRFGGGMIVGNSNGAQLGSRGVGSAVVSIVGTVISLVTSPTATNNIGTPGAMLLAPAVAAQFDRKYDDGLPGVGDVQAFGNANCVDNSSGESLYFEANTSKDCGLYVHIQG